MKKDDLGIPYWEKPAKTYLEAVKRMQILLSNPKRWTKGKLGQNEVGETLWDESVLSLPNNAVCFCIAGAWKHVRPPIGKKKIRHTLNSVMRLVSVKDPMGFNDRVMTTHKDIKTTLEKVKVAVEKKGW